MKPEPEQGTEEIRDKELSERLADGYQVRKQESMSVAKDFEIVDLKGWDEW